MARPVLIDEADGKCEICSSWGEKEGNSKLCSNCKTVIPDMLNMSNNGYQSPKPDHYHLKPVLGLNGREAVFSELCADCYLDKFSEAYPEAELPASVVINRKKKEVVEHEFSNNSN